MDRIERKYYKWNRKDLERALLALEKKEMGLNQIAVKYSVPKPTILRHAKKRNKLANDLAIHKGRPTTFNSELENILVKHILKLEKYMFGSITVNDVRRIAFDIAEKHNIRHKFNKTRRMAGKAWFYAFKGRHPELSLREAKSTSMNRVKDINKQNVDGFYDRLEKIVNENSLTASKIFNVDESRYSTVQKEPQTMVTLKGKKQIDVITSGERSVNTTAVCCASAAGQFVPPMIIFERAKPNPELENDAPPGSVLTISESGHINSILFVEWIQHFISVVKPSPENKVLLLLDGDTTHSKNLEALNLAKDNGIIMLQLPEDSAHRLQPLDVSFFKPMSTYYIEAVERWLRTNPGRQVTQSHVVGLFAEAYGRAAIIGNVSNGFRAAGVWPVNRNVFPEHLFEAAKDMKADTPQTSSNDSTSILQDLLGNVSNGNETADNANNRKENSPSTSTQDIWNSLKYLCPVPKSTQQKKNTIQKAVEITSNTYKIKLEESVTAKRKKNTEKNNKKKKSTEKAKEILKSQKRRSSTSSDDCEGVVLKREDDTDDDNWKSIIN